MDAWIRKILLVLIRAYQIGISPLVRPRCRFYPSCSEYAVLSLQKDPLILVLVKVVKRIICCNPFHPGGVDLP